MDTLTKSCSPTIVITANGEVQTHEEVMVYVKELDIFLTLNVLENTPAVLSLGKLCDENGDSYEWINGQKPHLIKDGIREICNTENFVPIVVPGLSSSSSKEFLEIVGNGKLTGSVWKETIAVSATISISVEKLQSRIRLRILSCSRMRGMRREPEVPEARVPVVECLDCPARITLKGTCTNSFCEKWHPPECLFYKSDCSTSRRMDADFEKSALMEIARLKNSLGKRSQKNGDKSAVAILKRNEQPQRTGRPVLDAYSSSTRQLGCVFQDMEPPKSSSILRKSSNIRKPIRCVKFTKAVVRHADIRDKNPSLGMICPGDPHQRNTNAPEFEDRSQEETEWQEQGAREAAWKLAKSVIKLKEKNRATFFSHSENRCLPASNLKPEEREFVVDIVVSMHIITKKTLNSAGMETLTKSCSPTIVITANGEVQTHEEVMVYVKEFQKFDFSWLWKSSKTRQQYCRSESFAMKTDILTSGSTVKNHIP